MVGWSCSRFLKTCEALEHPASVNAANQGIDQIFRVRHQAQDIEAVGINAGDGVGRAVRIGAFGELALFVAIAESDAALAFEAANSLGVRRVIALAMGDRDLDRLTLLVAPSEWGVAALDAHMLHAADEPQLRVAHENAGQKPEFDEDLEPIANAENEAAALGMGAHRRHDR